MVRSRGILIQRAMHVVVRQQASNILLSRPKSDPYKAGDTATIASVRMDLARPPVGPNLTAHCVRTARPVSSEFRHDIEPHAAVSGSARQTLPGARKGPRLACHQHFRIPRYAGLTPWPTHTWPAETSQYKLRRTPAISSGLRGPYHRTTWSVLSSCDAAATSH